MEFCTNQWTDLYLIGTSIMKELSHIITDFTESEEKKKNNLNVHVILISHVYISMFMSVSNDLKSHFG